MYNSAIHSGLDSLLLGIPFVGMLFVGYLRLDDFFLPRRPVGGGNAPEQTRGADQPCEGHCDRGSSPAK